MPSSDSSNMISLDQFGSMLAKAETLDEVTELRNRAEAVRSWARNVAVNLEMQNRAAELKLRAERKAGQLLSDLRLRGGDRKSSSHDGRLKLSDLGISQSQSKRWQKEAAIPEAAFQQYLRGVTAEGKEVTTAGLLRYLQQSGPRQSIVALSVAPRPGKAGVASRYVPSGRAVTVEVLDQGAPRRNFVRCLSKLPAESFEIIEEVQNHHAVLSDLLMPICNGQQETLLPGQRKGVAHYLSEVRRLLALALLHESADQVDRRGGVSFGRQSSATGR